MNGLRNSPNAFVEILKGNFTYVVIVVVLFVLLGIIALFNSFSTEKLNTDRTERPVEVNQTPNSNSTIRTPSRRATPTKAEETSTIDDEKTAVESGTVEFSDLSEIAHEAQKEVRSDGTTVYTFESLNPNRSDILIVKNGSIIFSRHAVIGPGTSNKYKNLLNQQAKIIPGPTFYGTNTSIYFYETGGTALIVDPQTDTTYEEFTFQPPISLEAFNSSYKIYTK